MILEVIISKRGEKDISKAPLHIVQRLLSWVERVETFGLEKTRQITDCTMNP